MILPIALGLLMQTPKPSDVFGTSQTSVSPSYTYNLDGLTFQFPAKEYDITISMDGDTMKIHFTKKAVK